jgi:hypothetical protein
VRREESAESGHFPTGRIVGVLGIHPRSEEQSEDKRDGSDEKAVADREHGPKGAA